LTAYSAYAGRRVQLDTVAVPRTLIRIEVAPSNFVVRQVGKWPVAPQAANSAATIFYTTDGTQPSYLSTAYTDPITVSSSETVNALAYMRGITVVGNIASNFNHGSFQSSVTSATYTINLPRAATPTFSVPAGTYTSAQTITIGDTTAGATIYYTTDGTTPTAKSTVYIGTISVSATETIAAIAAATGYGNSTVASAVFNINLPPPTFTVSGTAITVTPGTTTGNTSTITLTPLGGFTGTISLSCAITPTAASDPATCSLPASITIIGASVKTTTLTVNTTAATASLNQVGRRFWPSVGGAALAVVWLLGIPTRRRRWQTMVGMLALLISLTFGVLACGGGGSGAGGGGGGGNPGTTAGSYTVTVTGTSGEIISTGTITLTIQ
jgi:hypothetical protein